MIDMFSKLATSQKTATTVAGAAAVVAGHEAGLTDSLLQIIAGLFGLQTLVQGALDWKHGSRSDKTGGFANQR